MTIIRTMYAHICGHASNQVPANSTLFPSPALLLDCRMDDNFCADYKSIRAFDERIMEGLRQKQPIAERKIRTRRKNVSKSTCHSVK
jgi:hypothetical protein